MTTQPVERTPTWQEKLWTFVKWVVAILILVWLYNIATGARSVAEGNADALSQPVFDMTFVPGGPNRFADAFSEAQEASEDTIEPSTMLWATLITQNESTADGQEINLEAQFIQGVTPTVLASLPGYGNELTVMEADADPALELGMESLNAGDESFVFFGFNPQELPQGLRDDWASGYQQVLDAIMLESGEVEKTLYGRALG
jgi:hypothetical protein